jgi:taurine dioxygenase
MADVTALTPVGAHVEGVVVDALSSPETDWLKDLLAEHGVLIFRGLNCAVDDAAFVRFLRSFGELAFTAGETPVPGFGDLNVVSNIGRTTPPRSVFHVDTSYVDRPPAYTALRAVEIPESGGQTLFSNQYAAYDTLPAELHDELDGRSITHVLTGLSPDTGQQTSAKHPVFRVHPRSGKTALFMSTPQRCAAISGMSADRAADVIARLFAHSTREDNVHRHNWSRGDVVMWDNRAVMHCADHSGVVGDRLMHRGMAADSSE